MEDKKTYGHPLQAMSHRFPKIPYDSSVMDSGVHKNKARQTDNHFMYTIGLSIFHKQIQPNLPKKLYTTSSLML